MSIVIANTGGDVSSCSVAANSAAQLPDGLRLSPVTDSGKRTCGIAGAVAGGVAPGSYAVTVSGAGSAGAATVVLTINVQPPPATAAPALANVVQAQRLVIGSMADIPFDNSGGGSITGCEVMPNLPMGLAAAATMGGTSCAITGTPSVAAIQTTYTITATNAAGTDKATLDIAVSLAAPALMDAGSVTLAADRANPPIIFVNSGGSVGSTGCTVTGGALPQGLVIEFRAGDGGDPDTCAITGRPASAAPEAVSITVTARNDGGSDTATVSLVLVARLVAPSLGDIGQLQILTVNTNMASVVFKNTGGPVQHLGGCTLTAEPGASVPAGLSARLSIGADGDPDTCELTGTPTEPTDEGGVTLFVTGSNGAGSSMGEVGVSVRRAAPILGDIAGTRGLFVGQAIDPRILFANSGGDAQGCALSGPNNANPPAGLSAVRVPGPGGGAFTCAVEGTPRTVLEGSLELAVTATNAGGMDRASVTVTIRTRVPILADIGILQRLTVNIEIEPIVFVNTGGDVQQANGCSIAAGVGESIPMGLVATRVAATANSSATCSVTGTPTALTPSGASIGITMTATGPDGSDTADVSITVLSEAPAIANITEPVELAVGQEATPVAFVNTGGSVIAGGCVLTAEGAGDSVPTGVTALVAPGEGGVASCAIGGMPTTVTEAPVTLTMTARNANGSDTATANVSVVLPPAQVDVATVSFGYAPPTGPNLPGTMTLSWTAPANANGYRIFRNDSDDSATAEDLTGMQFEDTTTYQDASASNGIALYYWIRACRSKACTVFGDDIPVLARLADSDSDGLLDIRGLRDLYNVRHDLFGRAYHAGAGGVSSSIGCPEGGCFGYELMNDINFDKNGNGWTLRHDGAIRREFDQGDHEGERFNVVDGIGWTPIGENETSPFRAVFDGNGHSIHGVATDAGSKRPVGFFGVIGDGAVIRNLALVNAFMVHSGGESGTFTGGLVAMQKNGLILNCRTSGVVYDGVPAAENPTPERAAGGLVGVQENGSIVNSYSTARVGHIETFSRGPLGGLVGEQRPDGRIIASYATGDVLGGDSIGTSGGDTVGGLVGFLRGRVAASYTHSRVYGVRGNDAIGGFAGVLDLSTARLVGSYAAGRVDGGGHIDKGGALIGEVVGTGDLQTAVISAWAYGERVDIETVGVNTTGILGAPQGLHLGNAGSQWDDAMQMTKGAWDFYRDVRAPALKYADYDGGGDVFHCADAANPPQNAILIPNCGRLMPGPSHSLIVEPTAADRVTLHWTSHNRPPYYRVFFGPTRVFARAAQHGSVIEPGSDGRGLSAVSLQDIPHATGGYAWVLGCSTADSLRSCSDPGLVAPSRQRMADANGDGLVEIYNANELAFMRHNMDGNGLKAMPSSTPYRLGCPGGVCKGYALANDISFDIDGDGVTWDSMLIARRSRDDILDSDDFHPDHFDVNREGANMGGWVQIGDGSSNFHAVLDGNGFTIAGYAFVSKKSRIGLIADCSDNCQIRNLGIIRGLSTRVSGDDGEGGVGIMAGILYNGVIASSYAGPGSWVYAETSNQIVNVGGFVGAVLNGSTVQASYSATRVLTEMVGRSSRVGGLIGRTERSTVAACYATGSVSTSIDPFRAVDNEGVGGLIGWNKTTTLTASYATGHVDGGAGVEDAVGSLIGFNENSAVIQSWGVGGTSGGERTGYAGVANRPTSLGAARAFTASGIAEWNRAANDTMGAWDFGTNTQLPALRYDDYDGNTNDFECHGTPAAANTAFIIRCGHLIPGQR